jgi:threonine/homoserine/homoserine lactone efflux protein
MVRMDGVSGAAAAGVVAGAAVALPLGAIGVLLVQEAVTVGRRTASAGAVGVGLVDTAYSAVALLAGSSVSGVLAGYERAVQLTGALLLTVVAVIGLLGVRQAIRANGTTGSTGSTGTTGTAEIGTDSKPVRPSARRVLARFVTLTAVNPLTAIYFVALAAGSGDTVRGFERGAAFVVGVCVASLTWQLTLVMAGSLAGARLGDRARTVTGLVGYLVVLGYAARMAASAG